MKQVTVFIAGSTALSNEFNAVKSALIHVNNAYSGEIYINPYTFEDYDGPCSLEGDQEKYNYLIREVADYVIFVLDGDVGGITRKEFDIAWDSYVSQGRPGIYVYHKPTDTISNETQEVIDKVNNCKQYYKKYTDLENLSLKIQLHFTKQVKKILYDRPNNLLTAKAADLKHPISQNIQITDDTKKSVYEVRVNRPCHLLIDGKEVAILEEEKLTEIPLSAGAHQRKVVAIDDSSIFHEAIIHISEKPNIDIITLFTTGMDKAKSKALPSMPFQVGDYLYEALKEGNGVALTQCLNKNVIEVEIPRQISYNKYLHYVKSIDDCAFRDCTLLKAITIPSSVTKIGTEVLYNCPSLEHIEVDKDNSTYDSRNNCNAIIFTALNSLIAGCKNTIIPDGVKKIGAYVFCQCHALTSITIPNSVTRIGIGAFMGCKSLTLLTIPNSVIGIGKFAFANCSNLKSITIGDGVKVIDDGVFENCSSLESVILPSGIVRVGRGIVNGCSSLKSITIPRSVTEIPKDAFSENIKVEWYGQPTQSNTPPKLTRTKKILLSIFVSLVALLLAGVCAIAIACKTLRYEYDYSSRSATVVAKKPFFRYRGNIEVPFSVKHRGKLFFVNSIGYYAFQGCKNLTSIDLPLTLESIGEHAFDDCESLKYITIPDNVKIIGDGAFFGCSNLPDVKIPNSVKSIGDFAFCCSGLTSIDFPQSVATIGAYALASCSDLTSVTLPDSLTTIGEGVFSGCEALSSLLIPNSVTRIGEEAFKDCENIIVVNLPNSVKEIADNAFCGCKGLLHVALSENLTTIGDSAFYECEKLPSISIPNSVKSIGNWAFHSCIRLTDVTIPESVKSIGKGAFLCCMGITSITIPNSITTIEDLTFGGCTSLTSITIPDRVKSIGSAAFMGCISLRSVDIPYGVTSIGDEAFLDCSELTDVYVPKSVIHIGKRAFPETTRVSGISTKSKTLSQKQALEESNVSRLSENGNHI